MSYVSLQINFQNCLIFMKYYFRIIITQLQVFFFFVCLDYWTSAIWNDTPKIMENTKKYEI